MAWHGGTYVVDLRSFQGDLWTPIGHKWLYQFFMKRITENKKNSNEIKKNSFNRLGNIVRRNSI